MEYSFCECEFDPDNVKCHCGEDFDTNEWSWEEPSCHAPIRLSYNQREVLFNPTVSVGTAAVKGNMPFTAGRQYLWEVKMLSFIHGTDVVVGVGTAQVNLAAFSQTFIALLGNDSESWGLSYKGDTIHAGIRTKYGPYFGKGSIVGVHLNMWTGTLEFYLNRRPLGVAFKLTKNQILFPMISSTIGNSSMRLVTTMSWPASLELSCLQSISDMPQLCDIPGLRAVWGKTYWWQKATEVKKKVEENALSEAVEYELEIISSDEEEQERIMLRSRRILRNRRNPKRRLIRLLKAHGNYKK